MTDQTTPPPAPETPPAGTWTTPPADAAPGNTTKPTHWERDMIDRIVFASLTEQRRARRWNIFFKSLFFVYASALIYLAIPHDEGFGGVGHKHTALIEVHGVISADSPANADSIITGLRAAFEDKNTSGVIIRINSPGGSPVQAAYVNDEIHRLRREYPDIKVYAVIEDICASGGYYIAAGADKIYADKGSLVGSIGVLMDGFGFTETLNKLGVERRLITSGEHKGFLDPFSPLKPGDVEHMKKLLDLTHKQFIDVVKKGRGDRLKNDDQLFSGLIWNGQQGIELGLVDGLGSASYVAREVIGAEDIVDYTRKPHYLERFAERLGVAMANTVMSTLGTAGNMK